MSFLSYEEMILHLIICMVDKGPGTYVCMHELGVQLGMGYQYHPYAYVY